VFRCQVGQSQTHHPLRGPCVIDIITCRSLALLSAGLVSRIAKVASSLTAFWLDHDGFCLRPRLQAGRGAFSSVQIQIVVLPWPPIETLSPDYLYAEREMRQLQQREALMHMLQRGLD
jgi:hypothetical protein